ncbi:MAG TPA: S1C family serine protease [Hyphomicrobiaceae bacterium]|nr:S1C family serine protease [Hyphomicrobiaceae bacterium]
MRQWQRNLLMPAVLVACVLAAASARAQPVTMDDLAAAVVQVKAHINPDGRTAETLGLERKGSGVVIGSDGLVLTIGYIIVEAHAVEVTTNGGHAVPAQVVGYDHESGFGLVKATQPLNVRPMALGKSAALKERDPVLIASAGGVDTVAAARVVGRRAFAGSWEYLLEDAIFTAPPYPAWSGAALISREGKLVGVGSLIVRDATSGKGEPAPGNMFVPVDRLAPILADLIAEGRSLGPPRPWLGLTTEEVSGRLVVARVAADGPAEKAGLKPGDIIVGVGGKPARSLADFYRMVWAKRSAGASVPLDVQEHATASTRRIDVHSMNRMDHLKLKSTF